MALALALLAACSSDEEPSIGEYSTERTSVVTGIGGATSDGCGLPQAPVSDAAMFRYRVANDDGRIRVIDILGGCELEARIQDDVVVADGAECAFGPDSQLRSLGVQSRVYSVFRLDPRAATVKTRAVTLATVQTGEARTCAVTDERIVARR